MFLRVWGGVFECYPFGVADKNGQVAIVMGDSTSSVAAEQNTLHGTVAQIRMIDEVLRNEQVSFIKMDIEGSELAALKGAQTVIKSHKPILAICIYHSIFDMLDIPLYIKSLEPEYQIYIRHYTGELLETVCYAIPRERVLEQ